MFAFLKKILFALFLAVVVLFAYQNLGPLSQTVRFRFDLYAQGLQFATPDLPVVFLFLIFFLLGMLAAGFHGVYERMTRRAEVRRRDKRIRALEAELEAARSRLAELRPPAEAEETGKPDREPGVPAPARPAAPVPPAGPAPAAEDEPTL